MHMSLKIIKKCSALSYIQICVYMKYIYFHLCTHSSRWKYILFSTIILSKKGDIRLNT